MPSHLPTSTILNTRRPPITLFRVLDKGKLFLEMKWTIETGWVDTVHSSGQLSVCTIPPTKITKNTNNKGLKRKKNKGKKKGKLGKMWRQHQMSIR